MTVDPERIREVLDYVAEMRAAGACAEVFVDHNHGMNVPRIDRGAQTITMNRHDYHALREATTVVVSTP